MRLYGRWQITLPDEKYVFEPDEITNNEWRALHDYLEGLSFEEWMTGIDKRDPKPCDVLVWFLRHKDGDTQDLLTIDYPIRRLGLEQLPDLAGDEDPEAPAGSEPAT